MAAIKSFHRATAAAALLLTGLTTSGMAEQPDSNINVFNASDNGKGLVALKKAEPHIFLLQDGTPVSFGEAYTIAAKDEAPQSPDFYAMLETAYAESIGPQLQQRLQDAFGEISAIEYCAMREAPQVESLPFDIRNRAQNIRMILADTVRQVREAGQGEI